MNLALWFGKLMAKQYSPEDLAKLAMQLWPSVEKRIPNEQRAGFYKTIIDEHLGSILADMSREQRAELMNSLLPLVAKEFPLMDLDFSAAFPPDQVEQEEIAEK